MRRHRSSLLALTFAVLPACVGQIGEGGSEGRDDVPATGTTNQPLDCTTVHPGPSPIRRMTRLEYDHTVHDLLGDDSALAEAFPAEEKALGFDNSATARGVSSALAEAYLLAAETLAHHAVTTKLDTIAPCDSGSAPLDCGSAFVASFGKRAYRRSLEPSEKDALVQTFQAGLDADGYDAGIEYTLTRILQSPRFLYRVELAAEPISADAARLDGWEVASRLSYLLWQTMPDDALFQAAEAGELATEDAVLAQAKRMLADERARPVVAHFHEQWLELDAIDKSVKDPALYPQFTDDLKPLMREEALRLVDHVVWDEDGSAVTLLTAPYTFVDSTLAALYGADVPPGSGFTKLDLDPTERAGVLTQLGLLTATAKASQTSPIRRGKFVRVQLLCQPLPPPPPGVDVTVPEPIAGQTTRERFAAHTQDPACAGCHTKMDPIGFGFENYDPIGRWRTDDSGLPVDASGEVVGSSIGTFVGAVELANRLADSAEYPSCVERQWFRFAYGREESEADACSLGQLDERFSDAELGIQALLLALTQTDAFLYRSPP